MTDQQPSTPRDASSGGAWTPDGAWTMTLAEWAAGLAHDDLADEVVHHAKRVILDYIAATVAGSTSQPARILQDYLRAIDTDRSAVVVGTDLALSAPNAALANGTAAHGLEIDDGYTRGAFHPGGPVLSAVLAAAQARASSAEDIIVATVVGFELSCRLAAAGHPATWRRGFHNTPVAGVFGAAAGVARLIGGDTGVVANALGLAGSHAGGLFEFLGRGAEVKRYHAGKAGRDGLVSAELAVRGLTGPTTVLEGPHGYAHAFTDGDLDAAFLLEGLGSRYRMLDTYVKPYPCCRHLHGPIDAVLHLRQDALDVDDVRGIRVETYTGAARHDLRQVEDFLDAQMSIPYAVAVTLLHGEPHLEHFGEEYRRDTRVRELVDMVEVREADDCTRDYPAMRPARVSLDVGGRERSHRIDQPYGEPSNPVTDADLEAKLRRLGVPVIGEDGCKRIIEETWSLASPERLFAHLALR